MNEKRTEKRNLSSLSDPTMSEHEGKSETTEDKPGKKNRDKVDQQERETQRQNTK